MIDIEDGMTASGGSRKPDSIVYSITLEDNFGIIVDTKAYSEGYSLPISQADEMERYVRENSNRDEEVNPNKWWENFWKKLKGIILYSYQILLKENLKNN